MVPFRLLPLTIALTVTGICWAEDTSVTLKADPSLASPSGKSQVRQGPVFFDADNLNGVQQDHIIAEGNVTARTPEETFKADWLRYDAKQDEVHAKGHVEMQKGSDLFECDELHLKVTERLGEATPARFALTAKKGQPGRGDAKTLFFEGPNKYRMESARFTTCPVNNDDWYLRTSMLNLDYDRSIGTAKNIRLEYMGVPIMYAPTFDFALDDNRKSGFLSPSMGVSNTRGLEVITPWYWNIAPNQDATFTPRYMSQRGLQLGTEYRYLEPGYSGTAVVEALPDDRVYGSGRYREYLNHVQQFSPRLSGTLHFESVSDDTYFTDLSSLVSQTSQQNLPREGTLTYTSDWWNATGRVQSFQTLQDPAAPITPPYRRMPQILFNANRNDLLDGLLHLNLTSEAVHFDNTLSSEAVGNRLYAYPSLEMNFERSYGFIRPKIGVSYTQYNLSRNPAYPDTQSITRTLPIVSLDSGLYLDREMDWHGTPYVQTLEPRLYYVRIPYRDQTAIPIFDSAASDPLQPQLYTENQFIGIDRINEANQITLGVTSRFMETNSGLERLQVSLGQRYYFNGQQVTMPGTVARSTNSSNLLGQISGQITDRLRLNSGFQFDTHANQLAQSSIGGTYRAGPGKLVNADLRYTNPLYGTELKQIDLSWQWPIKSKWYSMGRFNYSVYGHQLVEGLAGIEYNAGCWTVRGVMQKLVTTSQTSTTTFFLQLELQGLTRLGPNPLDILKNSIPGYTKSDEIERH
ncbi:MAG: LPS-assembly protein LptD [Parasulfuritortus sp.]|jgi:LPS-assembly protein|nr:LPS-assembly protein LptD [Parasulfuritortus sp.]